MSLQKFFKNSSLINKLKNLLTSNEIKYVSFDIFDTLLRRDCEKPVDIFERVGRKAVEEGLDIRCDPYGFMNSRIYFEKKARLATTNEDITLEEIYMNSPYSRELQVRLIEIEKDLEFQSLHADSIISLLLEEVDKHNREIIVVSDMYLSKSFLKSVVESKFPKFKFKEFFVSSEIKLTKATGSIYPHVFSSLRVKPQNILHIGDNLIADIERAKEYGLHTLHFDLPQWLSIALDREIIFQTQYDWSINAARKTAALLVPEFETEEEMFAFFNGASIHGPVLAGFAKWILDCSNRLDIKKLLCVMREGELYKKVLEHFAKTNTPEIGLFYASRKATFLPSIDPDTLMESLSNILDRKNYSLRNFFEDLELVPVSHPGIIQLYEKEIKKVMESEKGLEIIRMALSEKLTQITELIKIKKDTFNNYLESSLTNVSRFAFIDYGAGGTINLQISKATPKQFDNFLLTSSERAHYNSNKIVFHSFLPFNDKTRSNLKIIHRTPEIFEYFHVGNSGTTLKYESDKKGVRIHTALPSDEPNHLKRIKAFNLGVDYYSYLSSSWCLTESSDHSRLAAISVLARQAQLPTEIEAKILGGLKHEDNFGSDNVFTIITEDEIDSVRESNLIEVWANRDNFQTRKNKKITWPSGVITLINRDFISNSIYHTRDKSAKHTKSIKKICNKLLEGKYDEVVVYGGGEFFDELELHLKSININIAYLIDKKAYFSEFRKRGYTVISPTDASDLGLPVVVASEAFTSEICENIEKLNISKTIITSQLDEFFLKNVNSNCSIDHNLILQRSKDEGKI